MTGGGKDERRLRRARPGVAAFRSPLTAMVAAFALFVQLLALPYHQARFAPIFSAPGASDVTAIAAAIKATFGDAAAVCVESDGKGGPAAPGDDCDDHCPLCQFAAEATALIAPEVPALPVRFDAASRRLNAAPDARVLPYRPASRSRARAPPLAV